MKLCVLSTLLVFLCVNIRSIHAYVFSICSDKGGICHIDDVNHLIMEFAEMVSNYLYEFYTIYCGYVCFIINSVSNKINQPDKDEETLGWFSWAWDASVQPVLRTLRLVEPKKSPLEKFECKNSPVPSIILFSTVFFYIVAIVLRKKPQKCVSKIKLDTSAYNQEYSEEDKEEIENESAFNSTMQKMCCGCSVTVSEVSEKSDSFT